MSDDSGADRTRIKLASLREQQDWKNSNNKITCKHLFCAMCPNKTLTQRHFKRKMYHSKLINITMKLIHIYTKTKQMH